MWWTLSTLEGNGRCGTRRKEVTKDVWKVALRHKGHDTAVLQPWIHLPPPSPASQVALGDQSQRTRKARNLGCREETSHVGREMVGRGSKMPHQDRPLGSPRTRQRSLSANEINTRGVVSSKATSNKRAGLSSLGPMCYSLGHPFKKNNTNPICKITYGVNLHLEWEESTTKYKFLKINKCSTHCSILQNETLTSLLGSTPSWHFFLHFLPSSYDSFVETVLHIWCLWIIQIGFLYIPPICCLCFSFRKILTIFFFSSVVILIVFRFWVLWFCIIETLRVFICCGVEGLMAFWKSNLPFFTLCFRLLAGSLLPTVF